MNPKEIARFGVYGLAAVGAAVIAILAYVKGDISTMSVALAWIGTNVLAVVNVPANGGDHADP